jgi:hypothetical protein
VGYLFKGVTGTARNVIALEIMEIVRPGREQFAPEQRNPFDDEPPGG